MGKLRGVGNPHAKLKPVGTEYVDIRTGKSYIQIKSPEGRNWSEIDANVSDDITNDSGTNLSVSVYDPAGSARQILTTSITYTVEAALSAQTAETLLLGQPYQINSFGTTLPSGLGSILTKGVHDGGTVKFEKLCRALLPNNGDGYIDCNYDVVSNTVTGYVKQRFYLTHNTTGEPILTTLYNDLKGVSYSLDSRPGDGTSGNTAQYSLRSDRPGVWNSANTFFFGSTGMNATAEMAPLQSIGQYVSTSEIRWNIINPYVLDFEPVGSVEYASMEIWTSL